MSDAEKPVPKESSKPGGPSKARIIGARVLTIVAILLALVGMVAFYVEHTALDEDGFKTISRNMIENDEIRTQVAAKTVDTLFENVDVEAAIAERLPPALEGARSGSGRSCALGRGSRRRRCARAAARPDGLDRGDDEGTAPARAPAGRRHDFHPDRGGRGRARSSSDSDRARRPGGGDRKGRREAARLGREDRDHRGEPARDGADGDEGPACRRGLDVARRARGRRACDLVGARAPQARAPCARDRPRPRRPAERRTPLRG